ncbi:hypothetical protein GGER_34730 [Serratia rubidaea]
MCGPGCCPGLRGKEVMRIELFDNPLRDVVCSAQGEMAVIEGGRLAAGGHFQAAIPGQTKS